MAADFDPEAEGLLDDAEGEDRDRLRALLVRLHERGAGTEELREALAGGRLALLAAERVLAGRRALLGERDRRARRGPARGARRELGGARDGRRRPDERDRTSADLKAAERLKELLDAGLEPDAVEETARVMSMALAQVAASHREMVAELVLSAGGGRGRGPASAGSAMRSPRLSGSRPSRRRSCR